jgi:hypothetical protein
MDGLSSLARQEKKRVGARHSPYVDASQVTEPTDSFSPSGPGVHRSCLGVQQFGEQLASLLPSTSLLPPAAKKTADVEFSQRSTREELEIAGTSASVLPEDEDDLFLG